ncbi:peptide deformylase [Thiohalorhabdus sp.]|uniref:peptide deformylase n=1 Tax=Thiohalorhabdus sp. TaxID=3094134 RepID=UPI002FC3CADD
MAVLDILHYPDERLRQETQPVPEVDEDLRRLIDDMLETMYTASGVGLAAPQVDHYIRMLVMDTSEDRSQPLALVNPEIVAATGEQEGDEGCLSLPGVFEPVVRAAEVTVRFTDREGHAREEVFTDLPARCVQHEVDHLEGKLFLDYLSKLKRNRLRKKMEKDKRLQADPA